MRVVRPYLPFALSIIVLLFAGEARATDTLSVSLSNGSTVTVGQPVSITVNALLPSTNTVDKAFKGTATLTVTTSDGVSQPPEVLVNGTTKFTLDFLTLGPVSITVSNTDGTLTAPPVNVNVVSTIPGCSSCFVSIGAGAVIQNATFNDYSVNNNTLETTSLDHSESAPQYLVGVAYKLPIRDLLFVPKSGTTTLYHALGCTAATDFNNPDTEAKAAYCYPYKAFISFKFSPDSSQTFNGFTYGITFAIHKDLDLLLGASYSPYNNISGGFKSAAVSLVTEETTAGNRCYSQWTAAGLNANGQGAFNGFPTQLLTDSTSTAATPTCSMGAQIYSGSVTTASYHTGLFIGVSIPIGLSQFFK
jgi:hypothetical protein